jgi:hypothetical protein
MHHGKGAQAPFFSFWITVNKLKKQKSKTGEDNEQNRLSEWRIPGTGGCKNFRV